MMASLLMVFGALVQAGWGGAGVYWVAVYLASLFLDIPTLFVASVVSGVVLDVAQVTPMGVSSLVSLVLALYAVMIVRRSSGRSLGRDFLMFLPAMLIQVVVGRESWVSLIGTALTFLLVYVFFLMRLGRGSEIWVRREM